MNMEMAARSRADDGSSSSGNLNLQCGWCVDEGRMVQVFSRHYCHPLGLYLFYTLAGARSAVS